MGGRRTVDPAGRDSAARQREPARRLHAIARARAARFRPTRSRSYARSSACSTSRASESSLPREPERERRQLARRRRLPLSQHAPAGRARARHRPLVRAERHRGRRRRGRGLRDERAAPVLARIPRHRSIPGVRGRLQSGARLHHSPRHQRLVSQLGLHAAERARAISSRGSSISTISASTYLDGGLKTEAFFLRPVTLTNRTGDSIHARAQRLHRGADRAVRNLSGRDRAARRI